jgi:[NiFe] hydrogenase diaphorase moiety large subunit
VIDRHVHRRDLILDAAMAPGAAIAATLTRGADATVAMVAASGLRGRGGAGFSTGQKWAACAAAPSPGPAERYVVCNADEGEPGTFKDRELLAHHADLVIEGMTVAGLAVGATRGLLYLRAEYPFLVAPLEATLAARRAAGLLGPAIGGAVGRDFDVELRIGAGAYVCGEESALLESLEGKRGIPRNRPPYPVTNGYRGRPTVVNNVETLAAAALIAVHGDGWWRAVGTPRSTGTKLLSVSGDVARPGIYEYPFGVAVETVLADAGARATQAVQVGGPSGTLLAGHELGRKIAFEDVPCAGAVMVFDDTRDVLAVVDNFARFFAHESCGFCTPCRVGTTLAAHDAPHRRRPRLAPRSQGPDPLDPGDEGDQPLRPGPDRRQPGGRRARQVPPGLRAPPAVARGPPTFDLDAALAPAREATGRDDAHAHLTEDGP